MNIFHLKFHFCLNSPSHLSLRALSGYSQLIVNGKIVVRKDNATGKLNVEGKWNQSCLAFYLG